VLWIVTVVLVALAGAVGACGRVLVDAAFGDRRFPVGILVVNVIGSFVLGVVAGLVRYHGLGNEARLVFGVGLCGAFTTFSTFALDVVRLAQEERSRRVSAAYLLTSVLGSLAAAAVGLALTAV
jgi:CrcB protein